MAKTKKKSARLERCQEIVLKATEESLGIIKEADHEDAVANFNSIHTICSKLVVAEGLSTELSYELIAAYGERMYGRHFIKPQTIKNRYRSMVAVWRRAYKSLVEASSEGEWTDFSKAKPRHDSQPLSAEAILRETIRRLQMENNRLRAQLMDDVTAVPMAPAERLDVHPVQEIPEILDVTPVRHWISRLNDENSPFVESPAGLKLSKNARIGMTVIDGAAFNAMKSL